MASKLAAALCATLAALLVGLAVAAAPASAEFGLHDVEMSFTNDEGLAATQAGAHPFEQISFFRVDTRIDPAPPFPAFAVVPGEDLKQLRVELPPGFVGDPLAVPRCSNDDYHNYERSPTGADTPRCPDSTAVGIASLSASTHGSNIVAAVFNLVPPPGVAAKLGFVALDTPVTIELSVNKVAPHNVIATVRNAPQRAAFFGSMVKLWGIPADPSHDIFRGTCRAEGGVFPSFGSNGSCPTNVPRRPFMTLPRSCTGELSTRVEAVSWQNPTAVPFEAFAASPGGTGCSKLEFSPQLAARPTSDTVDGAAGFSFELDFDQSGLMSVDGVAQSDLKGAVVRLPEGVSVNPSSATGLEGCTDAQLALETGAEPSCPDGSKIGTLEVTTPLLDEHLDGEMVLRTPTSTDPASGNMFRGALIVRNRDRGILVKVPGKVVADPQTGRLTADFDDNPQLPFDHLKVDVKGGSKGALALPQRCGEAVTSTTMTPWSGNPPVTTNTPLGIGGDCSLGFAPSLEAGMDTQAARANGDFAFRFARQDGEQWLQGLTAQLPKGLLASVKHVDLCSNAQANAGNCPAGSQIGVVDAKAGSGDPFVLEQKGQVFLTEGYKGGPYGLAVKIRPIAGPFRGAMELSPIVVRQAIHVDRKTAQVTAISDPFPLIHHGVPLRVREVTVLVNRAKFMLNPSDCSPQQVQATILSAEGTRADVANHFQASDCADLRFKPRLNLRLTGRRQVRTGRHPGVRAVVRQQGIREAGIEKAVVRLPKSLALDVDNAQALCEFEAGTKPDLENHCPKGSIVGRARAVTPLLNRPLVGNVYFVKNVRRSSTGNLIRTLPMIIVALRGEIPVNLVGESSTTRSGKLVNTFDEVPDAPVSRFNLNIRGGSNGILAVTRTRRSNINLCAKPRSHVAEADMDGQNGRRHDFNVRMKTPCRKRRQTAAAICRKRTNSKPAFRRCVTKVTRNRATAAKRKAAAKHRAARR
jgi:hypothetical protein